MNLEKIKRETKQFAKRARNCRAGLFRPLEKKVVFESYKGASYSDNPRAVSEKMHELYPDYKLVWALPKDYDRAVNYVPDYVEAYPAESAKYRKEKATAIAYVRNEVTMDDQYKKKGQLFIQTWHGDRGIKKILFDSRQARGIGEDLCGYYDHRITDLFIVGSEYAKERIKTAFRYHGRVLKTGCPRNDCLVFPENAEQIRERLGVAADKKILLYAPTLRRNSQVVESTLDVNETLRHFENRGGDWVCLVRAHPKSLGLNISPESSVIDVSAYPDMADLLMIADALITDYSSCAGDFILRRKPLLLTWFDYEQYIAEDRTFHVDPREAGFLIAREKEELYDMIDNTTDEAFAENCGKILAYFGTCESGHSAEDVCRRIDAAYRRYNA